MPVTRNLLRTVTASLAILPNAGFALGLGPIEVESTLDQPLQARIPIVSLRPGEIEGLSAGLASRELFERMGFERPVLLSQLQFSVDDRGGNKPHIRVTSTSPIREPLLDLLVEVRWSSGRLLRDYAVLLDPPITVRRPRPANAIAPYVVSSGTKAPVSSQTRATTSRPAPRRQVASGFDGSAYGPVQPGETLWVIASNTRPDRSVSVQQMMLALLRANPEAFFAPNVNSLSAGAVLRVPKLDEIASLTKDEAVRKVEEQNANTVAGTDAAATNQVAVKLVKPGSAEAVADEEQTVVPQDGVAGGSAGQGPAVGDSTPALIRLENGGMSLQLAGMDDLNSHIPTIVAVDDATLATGAVSDVMTGEIADSAGAAGAAEGLGSTPSDFEAQGASGQSRAAMEAGAAKFASQFREQAVPMQPVTKFGSPLTEAGAEAGRTLSRPSVDVAPAAEGTVTSDDALATAAPESALTANVDQQMSQTSEGADATPATGSAWEVTEWEVTELDESAFPASEMSAMDWQGASEDPTAMAMMPGWLQSVLGILNDPRSLAMAGGGVLLFLLLVLLLVRLALRRGSADMPVVRSYPSQSPELVTAPTLSATVPIAAADLPSPLESAANSSAEQEETVDPAAKADVLMAMGDYTQAAELLQEALSRESDRDDLAYKLLEARHAEANESGYLDAVENHRGLLEGGALWEQVLAMGSELAPEHPLFVVAQEGDGDWLFGAAESPPQSSVDDTAVMPVPSMPPPPPPPQSVATAQDRSSDVLEFVTPEKVDSADNAKSKKDMNLDLDDALEFDLGQFSMDDQADQSASEFESGVGLALEEEFGKLGDEDVEHLDLQDEVLKLADDPLALEPEADAESDGGADAGGEVLDFPTQPELTVAADWEQAEENQEEDSFVDTKLDLATAYLEMGDDSGARTLYEEVVEEGNAKQRQEAQAALGRIGFG